jgi:uncharacterized protein (TIGR04255 family)
MDERLYLLKVFTEIRHNPSLLYTDIPKLNSLANTFRDDFRDIAFNEKDKNIQLSNFDKKTIINFYNNRIVIDTDEPDYQYFKVTAQKAVDTYNSFFEVEPFNRVGIRYHWTIKYPSLKEARDIFVNIFFSKLYKIAAVDLGTIEGGQVELRLAKENKKYTIFIRPIAVRSVEIRDTDKRELIYDALLVDIDLFKEGKVSLREFHSLLDEGYNFTRSRVMLIMNLLGVKNNE